LEALLAKGQVKKCINLRLDRAVGHYFPKCTKDYASMKHAMNVRGPGAYSWPTCPADCPYYIESLNFPITVSRDQFQEISRGDVARADEEEEEEEDEGSIPAIPPAPADPLPAASEAAQLHDIDLAGFMKLVARMKLGLIIALVGGLGSMLLAAYQVGVFVTELRQANAKGPPDVIPQQPGVVLGREAPPKAATPSSPFKGPAKPCSQQEYVLGLCSKP